MLISDDSPSGPRVRASLGADSPAKPRRMGLTWAHLFLPPRERQMWKTPLITGLACLFSVENVLFRFFGLPGVVDLFVQQIRN